MGQPLALGEVNISISAFVFYCSFQFRQILRNRLTRHNIRLTAPFASLPLKGRGLYNERQFRCTKGLGFIGSGPFRILAALTTVLRFYKESDGAGQALGLICFFLFSVELGIYFVHLYLSCASLFPPNSKEWTGRQIDVLLTQSDFIKSGIKFFLCDLVQ